MRSASCRTPTSGPVCAWADAAGRQPYGVPIICRAGARVVSTFGSLTGKALASRISAKGDSPMDRLAIILSVIVGFVAVQSAQQQTTLRANAVKSSIGETVTVEDVVAQVTREPQSGFTYLNFGGEFPRHVFRAVIPEAVWNQIRGPVLPQSRVRVTGVAQNGSNGIPEIVCSDIKQFSRLEASTVPLPLGGQPQSRTRNCCRVCTTGKPCGDSCISRSYTCRRPPGCAC